MRIAARSLEESRAAESERMSLREIERRNAAEETARDWASLAGRAEKLSGLEARLTSEKKDVERRIKLMQEQERELEERRQEVVKMERDVRSLQEVNQWCLSGILLFVVILLLFLLETRR